MHVCAALNELMVVDSWYNLDKHSAFRCRCDAVCLLQFGLTIKRITNTINLSATHTGVSGPLAKLYFLSISMRAIFVSSRANLSPIQLRGPQPNGMWANWGRFAFASAVNLKVRNTISGVSKYWYPNTFRGQTCTDPANTLASDGWHQLESPQ